RLHARLGALRATHLLGWVRADAQEGRAFAARRGFRETGTVLEEYRLYVPDATTDAFTGLEARLASTGLRFASLAEMGIGEGPFLRALHRLWDDTGSPPVDPEDPGVSFATWRAEVL